jgi:hypothetical protein
MRTEPTGAGETTRPTDGDSDGFGFFFRAD